MAFIEMDFASGGGSNWNTPKELESLVPVMSDYQSASGKVLYGSENSGDYAWKAFNGIKNERGWWETAGATERYIGYAFTTPCVITKATYYEDNDYYGRIKIVKFQARNSDSESWTDLTSNVSVNLESTRTISFDRIGKFKQYIMRIVDATHNNIGIAELEFDGFIP